MVCAAVVHMVMNLRAPWPSGEFLELLSKYLIVMKGFPVLGGWFVGCWVGW
jgi:hypothetical protein